MAAPAAPAPSISASIDAAVTSLADTIRNDTIPKLQSSTVAVLDEVKTTAAWTKFYLFVAILAAIAIIVFVIYFIVHTQKKHAAWALMGPGMMPGMAPAVAVSA